MLLREVQGGDRLHYRMNILIDTSSLQNQSANRGIGRYTRELLQALRALPKSHSFYTSDSRPDSIALIHYPFFDFFFHTLPIFKKSKTVVTIHDTIPLLFPKQYPSGIRGAIRFQFQKLALLGVSHIITDSQVSKRDIIDHLHISAEKISVIPLAVSSDFTRPPQAEIEFVRKKYELPKNFLLYVGDINYNKNLPFLISVLRRFPKLSLVLVGKSVTNTSIPEGRAIRSAIESNELGKRVRLLDTVGTSQELAGLYSLATAYIQPSLYEGFGLPVLEAFACKTPVLCARAGSLPEVVGDAGLYFHPLDADECATVIERVLKFSDRQRQALIKKGTDQLQKFSWEKVALETLAVYDSVLRQK